MLILGLDYLIPSQPKRGTTSSSQPFLVVVLVLSLIELIDLTQEPCSGEQEQGKGFLLLDS